MEEAALALGIARAARPLDARAVRRRAPARGARRGAGRAARGWRCSTSRPRSSTPSRATSCSASCAASTRSGGRRSLLAEHRLERCLQRRRPRDRAARRGGRLRRRPARLPGLGGAHAPELQTPGARLFALAGRDAAARVGQGRPPRARADGSTSGGAAPRRRPPPPAPRRGFALRRRERPEPRSRSDAVWFEHKRGAAVLRGVDLAVAPGERVALMGRNGAGKSTLLRVAAGLMRADAREGARRAASRCCCRTRATTRCTTASATSCPPPRSPRPGSARLADRHPRDLSGGERQRLALAIVLHGERPAVVCLDEPTRGMDRGAQGPARRAARARSRPRAAPSIVATHDAEFAAAFAARTVLLGDGRPVADAPTAEVLGGGWYFATQTARILGGAALLPEDGAALLRAAGAGGGGMSWVLASFLVLGARARRRASRGTSAATRPRACSRSWRRWPRWPRSAGSPSRRSRASSRRPTSCCSRATCSAARRGSRSARSARSPRTCSSGRGRGRPGRWSAGAAPACSARCSPASPAATSAASRWRRRARWPGLAFGAVMNLHLWVTFSGDHTLAKLGYYFATSLAVRPRPRDRQLRVLPRLRARRSCARCARYRMRFEVDAGARRPRPRRSRVALLAARAARAAARRRAPCRRAAVRYLEQAPRTPTAGSGRRPASGSTQMHTGWAALGLAAAGRNPRDVERGGVSIVDYMRAHAGRLRGDLGERTRTMLALRAAGLPPGGSAGATCWASCCASRRPTAPSPAASTRPRSRSSPCAPPGRPPRDRVVRAGAAFIAGQANADGGFNFDGRGGPSGADDTGSAMQALAVAGSRGSRGDAARGALARPRAERRTAASRCPGRREQRAVHRLGGPGPGRRRARPGAPCGATARAPARLPALARRAGRRGPLLAHEHARRRCGSPARSSPRSPARPSRSPRRRAPSGRRRSRRRHPPRRRRPRGAAAPSAAAPAHGREPLGGAEPEPQREAPPAGRRCPLAAGSRRQPRRARRRAAWPRRSPPHLAAVHRPPFAARGAGGSDRLPPSCASESPRRPPRASGASRSCPTSCASSWRQGHEVVRRAGRRRRGRASRTTLFAEAGRHGRRRRLGRRRRRQGRRRRRRGGDRRSASDSVLVGFLAPLTNGAGNKAIAATRRHRVRDGGDPAHLARAVDGRAVRRRPPSRATAPC